VCIDYWTAELSDKKTVDVLVITDHFPKMAHAFPCQSQTAKAWWPQVLRTLTFCYNCTIHETTGFAPFYLMYGWVPRLPIDIMFQHVLQDDKVISHNEFVIRLKKDLSDASRIAQKHTLDEQACHARLYNRKAKGSPLAMGDRVLLANRGERGKRKLAEKWDSTPYDVVSVMSGDQRVQNKRCHYRQRESPSLLSCRG
jgi:hypothetical protein